MTRRPILALVAVVVLAVGASALVYMWISATSAPATVPYSQFLGDVGAGRVARVVQTGTTLEISGAGGDYQVVVPGILTDVFADVSRAADAGGAPVPEFVAQPAPDPSWLGLLITSLLSLAAVVVVVVLVLRLVGRPARVEHPRTLADRLRELDEAHRSGLITDDERERQRERILGEV
jgi:hypothetical protein